MMTHLDKVSLQMIIGIAFITLYYHGPAHCSHVCIFCWRILLYVFHVYFQVILNCNALPNLLHLLGNVRETVRKETCWTISNITAGSKQQIQVYHWYCFDRDSC